MKIYTHSNLFIALFNRGAIDLLWPSRSLGQKVCVSLRVSAVNIKGKNCCCDGFFYV
jgi:hypothetical protein